MTLLTDPVICWMVAGLAFLLACFPALYIVEALGRDVLESLPPEPPWPQRLTPTDMDEPVHPRPFVERHLAWDAWVDERTAGWASRATEELFWIKAVEPVSA